MTEIDDLQHTGVFRPSGEPSLAWGVLGTGWVANQFVVGTLRHTAQRIVAVGSRSSERSAAFAAQHGIGRFHASYSGLIDDPAVDAVYVAVTAEQHWALALQVIAAGKPVLVEKPFALTPSEAAEIREAARSAGVFAMEAMWTRYLPQSDAIRLLCEQGALGDIELVTADHGQALAHDPASRLLRPDLGGGALLDLGVYPIAFASELLGTPASVSAAGNLLPSGVDGTVGMLLSYEGSTARALLSTSISARTPTVAAISGTAARIEIEAPFYIPTGFVLAGSSFLEEPILRWRDQSGIVAHEGLSYQATAVARFVGEGRTESPLHGLDESVAILTTIEAARGQLNSSTTGPSMVTGTERHERGR
jgi:predicted dehydrogenase